MTRVIGNQTLIHQGSALRFDAAMLRSSSCVLHSGLADTFRTPPSPTIFSRAPHISVGNELLSPTSVVLFCCPVANHRPP
jgi:hypothetical protein